MELVLPSTASSQTPGILSPSKPPNAIESCVREVVDSSFILFLSSARGLSVYDTASSVSHPPSIAATVALKMAILGANIYLHSRSVATAWVFHTLNQS